MLTFLMAATVFLQSMPAHDLMIVWRGKGQQTKIVCRIVENDVVCSQYSLHINDETLYPVHDEAFGLNSEYVFNASDHLQW